MQQLIERAKIAAGAHTTIPTSYTQEWRAHSDTHRYGETVRSTRHSIGCQKSSIWCAMSIGRINTETLKNINDSIIVESVLVPFRIRMAPVSAVFGAYSNRNGKSNESSWTCNICWHRSANAIYGFWYFNAVFAVSQGCGFQSFTSRGTRKYSPWTWVTTLPRRVSLFFECVCVRYASSK